MVYLRYSGRKAKGFKPALGLDLGSSPGELLRFICQQKATLPGGPGAPGEGTSMVGLLIFHQQYIKSTCDINVNILNMLF